MARKKIVAIKVLLFFAVTFFALSSEAATRRVPSEYPTIQSAINACQLGDEVVVADGVYIGNGNRDISFSKYPITIRSENGPQRCIIDCQGSAREQHRGFNLNKIGAYNIGPLDTPTYRIKGLTIRGGYTTMGGGILCQDSYSLEISDCVIAGNFANDGGGLYLLTSFYDSPRGTGLAPAVITDCVIVNNRALRGGGFFCDGKTIYEEVMPTIKNCTIRENLADNGGGVYCGGGVGLGGALNKSANIVGCTVSGNSVKMDGGGILFWMCSNTINNCMVISNSTVLGGNGGGIACRDSNAVILGCTLADNSIQHGGRGGGIACQNSRIVVRDSTIKNNIVNSGGIDGGGLSSWDSDVFIANCSIKGNKVFGTRGGAIYSRNRTLTLANCVIAQNFSQNMACIFLENVVSGAVKNCTIVGNRCQSMLPAGLWSQNSGIVATNCIFWDNGNRKQIDGTGAVMPAINHSDVQYGWSGDGNIDADPKCFDMGLYMANSLPNYTWSDVWVGGDYRLTVGSPCINAGDPAYIPEPNEQDLDHKPRVVGGRIDMGAYEFNHAPIANAGSDQTAYAGIEGIVQVRLNGSASSDEDSGALTYRWFVDSNQVATGKSPLVPLSAGQHIIRLIVNDGIEASKPDEVLITVVVAIECKMSIVPPVLNRHSQGGRIMTLITLPQDILESQIDGQPLVLLPGNIASIFKFVTVQKIKGQSNVVVIGLFGKETVGEAINGSGEVEVKVAGKLKSGQCFYGADTIKVLDK